MNEKEYIEVRLQNQIDWFCKKSSYNQKMYKRLILIEILFSVSIPFITTYANDETPIFKVIIGLMGVSIALIAGLINLYKFNDNWINYRKTAETLKQEKYLYLTKSGIYSNDVKVEDTFHLLVTRVESILSNENSNWKQIFSKKPKDN